MEIELQSLIANKMGYNNESNISQEEDSYCKPKTSNFALKASWNDHK